MARSYCILIRPIDNVQIKDGFGLTNMANTVLHGESGMQTILLATAGILVGIGASFTGLGGGFLTVPLLLFMGYSAQKAVGTSFMAILIIAISALIAHNKLANIDYRAGMLLGIGGMIGAQIGARLIEGVPTDVFKKIFGCVLIGLAIYLFVKK